MGNKYGNAQEINIQPTLYTSVLGTPVLSDLQITGDSYNTEDGSFSFSDIKIPSALMVVSKKKNVIFTKVNGSNREIVEYIGSENYEISVNLKLFPDGYAYAAEDVNNFITMCNSNRVLKVTSWYLNQFQITDVVVIDFDLPQGEGELLTQQINIKMKATVPLEFQTALANNLPIF